MAKCPKCNQSLKHVDAKPINAILDGEKVMSLVYSCPHCEAAISIQVHPGTLLEYLKTSTDV